MKKIINKLFALVSLIFTVTVAALRAAQPVNAQAPPAANHPANTPKPIPFDQLGAAAGKQYQGDGLSVTATADGARLRCVFQRLEGQVTPEGLWLESTEPGAAGRLRVTASALGRAGLSTLNSSPRQSKAAAGQLSTALASTGTVTVAEQVARLSGPG